MMQRIGVAGLAFWLSATALFAAEQHPEVTFLLLPKEYQNQPKEEHFLPEGTVRLYRRGTYTEALRLPLNEPTPVPPGDWVWIAEAPGYVSVSSGLLRLGPQSEPKRLAWPVVPACELMLTPGGWEKISRLDVVSLDHGATYPILPQERQRLQVPAGRFLAYTVRGNTLLAISPPISCRVNEQIALEPPSPPPAHRQALMVHATLPEGTKARPESLTLTLETSPEEFRQADAQVSTPSRGIAFFLDVPARPQTLAITHPLLATHREALEPSGGSALELTISLKSRPTLEIPVDYMPQRPHTEALIGLFRCGDIPKHYLEIHPDSCEAAGDPLVLRQGLETYSFPHLDIGQYLAMAWIDGEELPGLEDRLAPFLKAEPAPTTAPLQTLEELHIFGHLLMENRPVAGKVLLEPLGEPEKARIFPTDADLLYHIFAFGQVRSEYDLKWLPPEERQSRSAFRGLPEAYMLRACDIDNRCRSFHHRSTWSGSGRLDIPLDAGAHLQLSVTDAAQGTPIAGAFALIGPKAGPTSTTHFLSGELFHSGNDPDHGASGEGLGLLSNAAGEIEALGLPPGDYRVHVKAEGYRTWRGQLALLEGESMRQEVDLEPLQPRGGLRVRFSDGRPAAGAFLMTFQPDGGPDYRCSLAVDTLGEVSIAEQCLAIEDRPWVALHPDAILRELSPTELRLAGAVELQPRSHVAPLRLRLRDSSGQPLREMRISLHFQRFILEPNHLLLASSTGHPFPYRTNAVGEVPLPFLDPLGALPTVEVKGVLYPLDFRTGGVVEVIVP
jgi:hypothetical protein